MKKSGADRLCLILSDTFSYASYLCCTKTDWALLFQKTNLKKTESWEKRPQIMKNLTYEQLWYTHTLGFGGFPCSQAQNLLIFNQPDPKNKFSQKNYILTQIYPAAPLIESFLLSKLLGDFLNKKKLQNWEKILR